MALDKVEEARFWQVFRTIMPGCRLIPSSGRSTSASWPSGIGRLTMAWTTSSERTVEVRRYLAS